jgi:cytidyltransferase-like protein
VYVDGSWDVFHAGHVEALRVAASMGDFLLVGIHDDAEVRARRGGAPHLPIMNVHERALSVLACRFVDEVVIGAPTNLTVDLVKTFNISIVAHGSVSEVRMIYRVLYLFLFVFFFISIRRTPDGHGDHHVDRNTRMVFISLPHFFHPIWCAGDTSSPAHPSFVAEC